MSLDDERALRSQPKRSQEVKPEVGGVDASTIPDPVPLSVCVTQTVGDLVRRVEVEQGVEAFMYRLGYECGKADGRAEADAELEAIRLDREEVARLRPTGETCPCGRGVYARRSA